jgi:hypothetical protein
VEHKFESDQEKEYYNYHVDNLATTYGLNNNYDEKKREKTDSNSVGYGRVILKPRRDPNGIRWPSIILTHSSTIIVAEAWQSPLTMTRSSKMVMSCC